MKRNITIDCVKGLASLLVVIGHVFDGYKNAGLFSGHSQFINYSYNLIYSFHMALFFIVSGYVFKIAYINNGEIKPNLKRQKINVLIIYVVYSIGFGFFKIICSGYVNNTLEIKDLLLIWVKTIPPYWYLYVLLIFYILFSFKKIISLPSNAVLLASFAIMAASCFIPFNIGEFFEIKHILYFLMFFYIGIIFDENKIINNRIFIGITSLASIVLLIIYSGQSYNTLKIINGIIALGISLLIINIFKFLFKNEKKNHVRFFSFLGRYSLEIYVIHCVFTAGNRVVLNKLHITNFWINIIFNVVLSTAFPILISVLLKKIKLHSLFFKPVSFYQNLKEKRGK